MATKRNSFSGMNQDISKSKQTGNEYFYGKNIKIVTEEGSSTGNIENEDGNLLSFIIPDTPAFWEIKFNDPEDPAAGTVRLSLKDSTTGIITDYVTSSVDSVEDLLKELESLLGILGDEEYKIVRDGKLIRLFPIDGSVNWVAGTGGLSQANQGRVMDTQSNLEIIGWTTLRDEVVVFTTNEDSESPSSAGQIWKFKIDPVTKTIDNITANNELSIFHHLMYNNVLNFSKHWHIGTEAIGHYENSKVGRVYWTDEYNELRSANLLDPDLIGKSPGILNVTSQVNLNIPVFDSVIPGNVTSGSSIQYCYRLFNEGGAITSFSPVCNPIPLGDFIPTASNDYDNIGGNPSGASDKGVRYVLNDLDTSFTHIEHIAIGTVNSGPVIYKFHEELVPSDGNLIVNHTALGNFTVITPEEFVFINRAFKRCKTITVKDKRLIAANLDTVDVSVDGFDSRAYRFDNNRVAVLEDNELTSVTLDAVGSTPDWDSVPEEHDVRNPYNKDENDFHRFQSDGLTMGGSGKNISYKFIHRDVNIKNTIGGTQLFGGQPITGIHSVDRVNKIGSTVSLNGEERVKSSDYTNFKSAAMTNTFTGYARGEVYRFGIVFYDKSGNPFNVKWIGDIRFPEAYDTDGDGTKYYVSKSDDTQDYYNFSNPIKGRTIGIEFNVDISSVKQFVSGYEIVRVKREEQHKTKLGTGIFTNFDTSGTASIDDGGYSGKRDNAKVGGVRGGFGFPVFNSYNSDVEESHVIRLNGSVQKCYVIPDRPNITASVTAASLKSGAFISPMSIMSSDTGYSFSGGDRLKTLGYYFEKAEYGSTHLFVNTSSDPNFREVSGVATMGHNWLPASGVAREWQEIEDSGMVAAADVVPSDLIDASAGRPFLNCSPSSYRGDYSDKDDENPAGLGDVKQVVKLKNRFTYYGNGNTNPSTNNRWRYCSYEREVLSQYGGDTFEARSKNEYISTGAFDKIYPYSNSDRTFSVYGGDTYVHQFGYLYYYMNWPNVSGDHFEGAQSKYHLGWNFPVETSINLAYMRSHKKYGNKDYRDWYSTGIGPSGSTGPSALAGKASYVLDDHYIVQNDIKKIFYPEDYINFTVEEHPHMIWASEHKIDGELLDSWRVFLVNNNTEVDGMYGEINKITTINDKFLFYQDRAFGVASINDRSVINDENGVALTLGSGGILDDYGYVSRITGTKQKFSVVPTDNQVHHFDTLLKKWYVYTQGNKLPLSDAKGLHSFFAKYNSNILKSDRILEDVGIHGVYDPVRNKVLMTFFDAYLEGLNKGSDNYTISFNGNTQSFESFSDDKPQIWLRSESNILSVNPNDNKQGWLAYAGDKNNFYGSVKESEIHVIVNPAADLTCVMDNIEYKSEMLINDIDQSNLTLDSIRVFNDHQDSGTIPLTVNENVVRKLRSWRMKVPRDAKPNDPRIRDYYMRLVFKHTPNNNERLILHDIITHYRPSPH